MLSCPRKWEGKARRLRTIFRSHEPACSLHARFFLFGQRLWFVVASRLHVVSRWALPRWRILALWVVGTERFSIAPQLIRWWTKGHAPRGRAAFALATLLAVTSMAMAAGIVSGAPPAAMLVAGLGVFGVIFALNSAVHSYLILAYSDGDKVALNVGFYYMANASGRLMGPYCVRSTTLSVSRMPVGHRGISDRGRSRHSSPGRATPIPRHQVEVEIRTERFVRDGSTSHGHAHGGDRPRGRTPPRLDVVGLLQAVVVQSRVLLHLRERLPRAVFCSVVREAIGPVCIRSVPVGDRLVRCRRVQRGPSFARQGELPGRRSSSSKKCGGDVVSNLNASGLPAPCCVFAPHVLRADRAACRSSRARVTTRARARGERCPSQPLLRIWSKNRHLWLWPPEPKTID